jgi:hypothetical protein
MDKCLSSNQGKARQCMDEVSSDLDRRLARAEAYGNPTIVCIMTADDYKRVCDAFSDPHSPCLKMMEDSDNRCRSSTDPGECITRGMVAAQECVTQETDSEKNRITRCFDDAELQQLKCVAMTRRR